MPAWLFPSLLLPVPVSAHQQYSGAIVLPPSPWQFGPYTVPALFRQLSGTYKVTAQVQVGEQVDCTANTGSLQGQGGITFDLGSYTGSLQAAVTGNFTPSPFAWTSGQLSLSGEFGPKITWPLVDFLPPQVSAFVATLPTPVQAYINQSALELAPRFTAGGALTITGGAGGPQLSGGARFGARVGVSAEVNLLPVFDLKAQGTASGTVTLCAPPLTLTPQFGGVTGGVLAQMWVFQFSVANWTFIPPLGNTPPCSAGPAISAGPQTAGEPAPQGTATPTPPPQGPALAATPAATPSPVAQALGTSAPALALDANGSGLMAWVGIPSGSTLPAVDATELYVAPVTAGQAGAPVRLTSDAQGDYSPQVVKLPDGTFLIAWERNHTANMPDPGGVTTAFLGDLGVAYSIYNPVTQTATPPTFVSTTSELNHAPKLAESPSGQVLLTWLANPANALVGDSTNPDQLMWTTWNGTGFTAPQGAFTVAGALSQSLAYGSKEAAEVFWQMGGAGASDISVAHFNGTGWSALTPITTDGLQNIAPRLVFTPDGNPFLVWDRQGQMVYIAGSWSNPFAAVGDASGTASASGQQLTLLPDGDVALVWPGVSASGTDLYERRWFTHEGLFGKPQQWGPVVQLTQDGQEKSALAIAGDNAGVTAAYLGAPATVSSLTAPLEVTTVDADADQDSLTDNQEVDVYHTDPLNPYTADDGYTDGQHVALGKDPLLYCPVMRADVDGDGSVSVLDLAQVAAHFLETVTPQTARLNQGPPPRDNTIDILDLATMASYFLQPVTACP